MTPHRPRRPAPVERGRSRALTDRLALTQVNWFCQNNSSLPVFQVANPEWFEAVEQIMPLEEKLSKDTLDRLKASAAEDGDGG